MLSSYFPAAFKTKGISTYYVEWDPAHLTPAKLAHYARKIERMGALIGIVWEFIDGTIHSWSIQFVYWGRVKKIGKFWWQNRE